MLVVFFSYGLAFFLLGVAILLQPRRGSAFKIGNSLWLLAGFGIFHGLGEWMDMFLTLGDAYWTSLGTEVINKAHGIDPFFVVSCVGDFLRCLNRFQRSMSPTEPDPGALPARLSWSGFNGHWVLAATEVVIHSRSRFPSGRSKPDGNGGRFCPLCVLCRSGRSQCPFFPSIST